MPAAALLRTLRARPWRRPGPPPPPAASQGPEPGLALGGFCPAALALGAGRAATAGLGAAAVSVEVLVRDPAEGLAGRTAAAGPDTAAVAAVVMSETPGEAAVSPGAGLQAAAVRPAADEGLRAESAACTAGGSTGRTAAPAKSVAAAFAQSHLEGMAAMPDAVAAAGPLERAAEPAPAAAEGPLPSAAAAPDTAAGAGSPAHAAGSGHSGHRDSLGAAVRGASPCGGWPLLLRARVSGGPAIAHAGQLYGFSGAAARALFAAAPAAVADAAAAAAARGPAHLAPLLGVLRPAPCQVRPQRTSVVHLYMSSNSHTQTLQGTPVNAGDVCALQAWEC